MKKLGSAVAAAAALVTLLTSSVYAVGGGHSVEQKGANTSVSLTQSDVGMLSAADATGVRSAGIDSVTIGSASGNSIGQGITIQALGACELLGGRSSVLGHAVKDAVGDERNSESTDIPLAPTGEEDITDGFDPWKYAAETGDAQYLKYLHSLEEDSADTYSNGKGRTSVLGFYGSDELVHNSRFDDVKKDYGIDVSYFQPSIDWNKVKASGVEFAVIRLGYRSYVKAGPLVVDRDFHKNIQGAKAAGVQVGVYFYTQATTPEEAREEAEFCANALKDYKLDLPVFYDIETADFAPEPGRLDSAGLSVAEKTQLCRSFCDRVVQKGYYSGIYANNYWLTYMIDGEGLSRDYPIWVATYGRSTAFTGLYDMWQYSSKGVIDGISTNVDLNVRYYVDHSPTGVPVPEFKNGTLSWTAVSGADGYEVYSVDKNDKVNFVADAKGTSYEVTDPKIKAYFVKPFRLYGGRRYTGKASEQADAIGKVRSVSCARTGIDKVRFTWEKVEGATGYEVYTDKNGEYSLLADVKTDSAEMSGKELQKYHVKVRAYNSERVYGKFSEVSDIKGNMPDSDVELRSDSDLLLWNVISEADGYTVFSQSGGSEQKYDVSCAFFSVPKDVSATYQVKAYCTLEGKRFYSGCDRSVQITASVSAPKGRVKVTAAADKDNTLRWNSIADCDGYGIFCADGHANEFEVGRTDLTEYSVKRADECMYYVKPYIVTADGVLYGEASQAIGFFNGEVTAVDEIISDDDHSLIKWSSSRACDKFEIYVRSGNGWQLFSEVNGDMAVIAKDSLPDAESCIVIPVIFVDDTPFYGRVCTVSLS